MSTVITRKLKLHTQSDSPREISNFFHLYLDVGWFGILFGSTLSFLAVFAIRLGAAGWQVGLLTAGPALVNVLFAIPAGRWIDKRSLTPAVTRAAFYHRLGYFVLIPLPFFLPDPLKVWVILTTIILMAIPGSALAVGFNGLLAMAVTPEKRGRVVGWRNALLAGATVISYSGSGWLLEKMSFEWGYMVVFGLGALGAVMSTHHLRRIKLPATRPFLMRPLPDRADPGRTSGFSGTASQRFSVGPRVWLKWRPGLLSPLQQVSRQYRWVMMAYFLFHFSQMLPGALFPLFWVRELHLSDGTIGWVNALFYVTMLVASPFLGPLTRRFGNYRLTAIGGVLLALYPLFNALSHNVTLLIIANMVGGVVWAILSGTFMNRLLEIIPEDNRSPHLALYNICLNIATLMGTMLGPVLANITGLREALFIVFALRVIGGLALARWG
jgi:MFS family permease